MSNFECPSCKVVVSSEHQNCPLCGKFVDGNDGSQTQISYPHYNAKPHERLSGIEAVERICWILLITTLLVNAFIILYPSSTKLTLMSFWSVFCILGYAIVDFCIFRPIRFRRVVWGELFFISVLLSAMLFVSDFFVDGSIEWSIPYSIPIMLAAMCVLLVIFTLVFRKVEPSNMMMTSMVLFFFSACTFAFNLLSKLIWQLDFEIMLSFVCFAVSFACILYVLFFRFREYRASFFKKFHI